MHTLVWCLSICRICGEANTNRLYIFGDSEKYLFQIVYEMEEVRSCEHAIFGEHRTAAVSELKGVVFCHFSHNRRLPDADPTKQRRKDWNKKRKKNQMKHYTFACVPFSPIPTSDSAAIFSFSSHPCSSHFNGGMCADDRHCRMEHIWTTNTLMCSVEEKQFKVSACLFVSLVWCWCTASVWTLDTARIPRRVRSTWQRSAQYIACDFCFTWCRFAVHIILLPRKSSVRNVHAARRSAQQFREN